ncbi:glycosyltransferase family 9 protein [Legionella israelensis]|uniref:Glycosyltransferase family 9 protein n=1 Tax=Legionella israelensis TaxID=454 RepID=A0AAX1EDW8_9GAMM|nr:glycosyltransferase family 9 protein [Legionella israelensis]QBR83298.1 glycosyltransferase family 9 protein [Legionella israelensis]
MIQSVCVVRLSALGDVLMMVPLIRTLQAHFQNIKISWVISRPAYDLVAGMDGVEFIVIDKPKRPGDYWRFKKNLQGRKFDVLLAAQASFRANLLYPLIKAKRKIGYDKLRAKDGHGWFVRERISFGHEHTLEGFLKFAEPLGIKHKMVRWDLPISAVDKQWARQYLSEYKILIVNPAASKPERCWPVERYIEVIRRAQQRWKVDVILTGGPGALDKDLAAKIMQEVKVRSLVGQTKPKQLLALISQADAVLCPDTGPSHMAAAVGTPVVALHAVTSSEVSGPYTFLHLTVDCYPQAVEQILGTTLEKNMWGTHAHGAETMKLVQIDAVMEKLAQIFDEK